MKIGNKIKLGKCTYTVKGNITRDFFLDNPHGSNDAIFGELKLDKHAFVRKILGYPTSGIFPECRTLEDLEKLVEALQEKLKPMTHNFPEGKRVVCKTKLNADQIKEVMKLCIDADINIACSRKEYLDSMNNDELLQVDEDGDLYTRDKVMTEYNDNAIHVSFTEFKKFFIGKGKFDVFKPITVKLNREYSAVVNKTHIQVGCQRIEFDVFKQLSEAVEKATSKK